MSTYDIARAADILAHTTSEPVEAVASVAFQPTVHIDRLADGSITLEVDWSDALLGEVTEDGHDDRTPVAQAASALLDAWLKEHNGAPMTATATFALIPGRA